jgi:AhpD family alkylhydroperoxidase
VIGPSGSGKTTFLNVAAGLDGPTAGLVKCPMHENNCSTGHSSRPEPGCGQLHKAAVADGAVPAKVKELMALAIAVARGCDGCIAYHAKAAVRGGATAEEVSKALGVALLMDGGTASMYGPRAWDAYPEFAPPASAGQPLPSHEPARDVA